MSSFKRISSVTALYVVVALVMTWPLATVITRQIAGDNGDTLFNCWALLWTSGQIVRALRGDVAALAQYWNGNIFYPSPLTLAYSEHLTPQMLQAFPVLSLTGNIVLAYNVVFLATIVLSAIGMYLLVRELTGHDAAAYLAGLAFAFAPYRMDQFEHIQVLSSQWMPFAFYGFRRFFVTANVRPLVGGAVALVAQALSCGYYLAYFTPLAVAYVLYELVAHGKSRDGRTWRTLVSVGGAAAVLTATFLWPYFRVRQIGDVGLRQIGEIEHFSADTHAFATVSQKSLLWGTRVRAMPHDEGQGFPGFTILGFAACAIGVATTRASARARQVSAETSSGRRQLVRILEVVLTLLLLLLAYVLVKGPDVLSIGGVPFRYGSNRLLIQIGVVGIVLAAISPAFRVLLRGVPGSSVSFFAWGALAAAWMSLGPTMYANGRRIGPGLYDIFYEWAPGFTGLRVPSLNFMLVAFMLAVLAGLGAALLTSASRAWARVVLVAGMIAILAESWSSAAPRDVPMPHRIYDTVRALPSGSVVAEFPFGNVSSEILYTFYAGFHRKPILNGYSGFFPGSYSTLVARLAPVPKGEEAWGALLSSGATHAVVHEDATDSRGLIASEWLRGHRARETAVFGTDRLFELRTK
jgi:hypothetical protein